MRTLILLRHAKSRWTDPSVGDHERPLTKRGIKAASRMGRYIADNKLIPDLILCSDAVRTRATLKLVAEAVGEQLPPTCITEDLYLASPDTILSMIASQPYVRRRIMVIGHNPGLHMLALTLPVNGETGDIADLAIKYPTAALAEISFDTDTWDDIQPATGTLKRFIVPRNLTA